MYPGGSATEPDVIAVDLGQATDLGVWFLPPPLPAVRVTTPCTRGIAPEMHPNAAAA